MITFIFTVKGIGGVQNLYLNLIKELSVRGIRVKLIYFKDTWLTNELDRLNISYKLFDLEEENIENINSFVFPDDILVDTSFGSILYYFYKINPYYLFWNVFPTALSAKVNGFVRKQILKYIIIKMQKKNGLVFMDDSGVKEIERVFNIKNNIHYLPIPIEISASYNLETGEDLNFKKLKNYIPISYIGRAELWKVIPIKKIVLDLQQITADLNKKFCVHIITDNKEEFKNILGVESTEFVKIEYHTDLTGEKLKKFLFDEILINFSMGTSCLESASVGVPSILLDCYPFSSSTIPVNYKYRWLNESSHYNLGNILELNQPVKGQDLKVILENSISLNGYLKDISDKCFAYAKENHDLEIVTNNFIDTVNQCKNRLRPCLRYSVKQLKREIIFNFKK